MISTKSNKEAYLYKQQYKSQESARELNKREQRRLDQEVGGRGGIEAEYKFNLERVNQERKTIEKELEKIRQGARNTSALPIDKKLHHSRFRDLGESNNKTKLPSPSPRRKHQPENYSNHRTTNDSPVDTAMLLQYLETFNKAHALENNNLHDEIKGLGQTNQNRYNDIEHEQIDPLIISDQIVTGEAKNSVICKAEGQNTQTASCQSSQFTSRDHLESAPPNIKTVEMERRHSVDMTSRNSHSSRRFSLDTGKRDHNVTPQMHSDTEIIDNEGCHTASKVEEKTKTTGKTSQVAADVEDELKKAGIGPDSFNPDGSLKTIYSQVPFDKRWEEAKKARYIRTREPLERDRQLTANEIFGHAK